MTVDLGGLNILLKATSKQVVEKLINLAFISRDAPKQVKKSIFQLCAEIISTLKLQTE